MVSLSAESFTVSESDGSAEVCADLMYDDSHNAVINITVPLIPSLHDAGVAGITAGILLETLYIMYQVNSLSLL